MACNPWSTSCDRRDCLIRSYKVSNFYLSCPLYDALPDEEKKSILKGRGRPYSLVLHYYWLLICIASIIHWIRCTVQHVQVVWAEGWSQEAGLEQEQPNVTAHKLKLTGLLGWTVLVGGAVGGATAGWLMGGVFWGDSSTGATANGLVIGGAELQPLLASNLKWKNKIIMHN